MAVDYDPIPTFPKLPENKGDVDVWRSKLNVFLQQLMHSIEDHFRFQFQEQATTGSKYFQSLSDGTTTYTSLEDGEITLAGGGTLIVTDDGITIQDKFYSTNVSAGKIVLASGDNWDGGVDSIPTRFEDDVPNSGTGIVITTEKIGHYKAGKDLQGTQTGTFEVGEKVIQASSNAEGIVVSVPSGNDLFVDVISGTFITGSNTVTGQTSSSTITNVTGITSPQIHTWFVDSNGRFYFGGDDGNYITWDGTNINIFCEGGYIGSTDNYFDITNSKFRVGDAIGTNLIYLNWDGTDIDIKCDKGFIGSSTDYHDITNGIFQLYSSGTGRYFTMIGDGYTLRDYEYGGTPGVTFYSVASTGVEWRYQTGTNATGYQIYDSGSAVKIKARITGNPNKVDFKVQSYASTSNQIVIDDNTSSYDIDGIDIGQTTAAKVKATEYKSVNQTGATGTFLDQGGNTIRVEQGLIYAFT
jgi:hypothetical protein